MVDENVDLAALSFNCHRDGRVADFPRLGIDRSIASDTATSYRFLGSVLAMRIRGSIFN